MLITISLPDTGKPVLKVGQTVSIGDLFVKGHEQEEVRIAIAELISIQPRYIFRHLKKNVGDSIVKDEIIAEKKSLLSSKKYASEFAGVIKEIDHIEGIILLEVSGEAEKEQRAYFAGEVAELEKREIHVKVKKGKEYESKQISQDFGGKTFFQKNNNQNLTEEDVQGNVFCCRSLVSYDQRKVEALGAVGIVSLHSLPEPSTIPFAKIAEIKDWEAVIDGNFPYCVTNKRRSTIYFYSP